MRPETSLEEIVVEHFPNLVKGIHFLFQTQQTSNRLNMEKTTSLCIIVKTAENQRDQDKILKETRAKCITYNNSNHSRLFLRNYECEKTGEKHLYIAGKIIPVNPEFYVHNNIFL